MEAHSARHNAGLVICGPPPFSPCLSDRRLAGVRKKGRHQNGGDHGHTQSRPPDARTNPRRPSMQGPRDWVETHMDGATQPGQWSARGIAEAILRGGPPTWRAAAAAASGAVQVMTAVFQQLRLAPIPVSANQVDGSCADVCGPRQTWQALAEVHCQYRDPGDWTAAPPRRAQANH